MKNIFKNKALINNKFKTKNNINYLEIDQNIYIYLLSLASLVKKLKIEIFVIPKIKNIFKIGILHYVFFAVQFLIYLILYMTDNYSNLENKSN